MQANVYLIAPAKKAPAGNRARSRGRTPSPAAPSPPRSPRWAGAGKLFIVYRLSDKPMHFAALRRSLPEMSSKVLTEQLREMQADELVDRDPSGPVPAPVVYAFTAHGRSLMPVAEAIRRWGIGHQEFCGALGSEDVAVDRRAACI